MLFIMLSTCFIASKVHQTKPCQREEVALALWEFAGAHSTAEVMSEQDQLYIAQIASKRQKIHEEQLQAYREDLAEWLTGMARADVCVHRRHRPQHSSTLR
jgi:hypothetical protein